MVLTKEGLRNFKNRTICLVVQGARSSRQRITNCSIGVSTMRCWMVSCTDPFTIKSGRATIVCSPSVTTCQGERAIASDGRQLITISPFLSGGRETYANVRSERFSNREYLLIELARFPF